MNECTNNYNDKTLCNDMETMIKQCWEEGKGENYCKTISDATTAARYGLEKAAKSIIRIFMGKSGDDIPKLDEDCSGEISEYGLANDQAAQLCEKYSDTLSRCAKDTNGDKNWCGIITRTVWNNAAGAVAGIKANLSGDGEQKLSKLSQMKNTSGYMSTVYTIVAVAGIAAASIMAINIVRKYKNKQNGNNDRENVTFNELENQGRVKAIGRSAVRANTISHTQGFIDMH